MEEIGASRIDSDAFTKTRSLDDILCDRSKSDEEWVGC